MRLKTLFMPLTSAFVSRTLVNNPPSQGVADALLGGVLKYNSVTLRKFEESQHPRDRQGKFSFTTGSVGTTLESAERDKTRFKELKAKWAVLNAKLLPYVHDNRPDAPEAKVLHQELKGIVKEMFTLHADTGGVEGIGLPGEPRDIVVVGAGPGGLTAAMVSGTDGLDVLLIDGQTNVGGQFKSSSRIENFIGFPVGITGADLAKRMDEQARSKGAEMMLGIRVTNIAFDPDTELKTLTLSDGKTITTRAVILAGGVAMRTPEFPGSTASNIYGDAEQLARAGTGKHVVVVGGSNGAAQAALGAVGSADKVTVISRSPVEKGMSDYQVQALKNSPNITVIEGDEISHVVMNAEGHAQTIVTKNGQSIETGAIGMFIGGGPDANWLPKDIKRKSEKGKPGQVLVDGSLETSMPGVFAVGDIRAGSAGRIATAAADGMMAERNIINDYFHRSSKPEYHGVRGEL